MDAIREFESFPFSTFPQNGGKFPLMEYISISKIRYSHFLPFCCSHPLIFLQEDLGAASGNKSWGYESRRMKVEIAFY